MATENQANTSHSNIEIKISRTNLPVPVVQGIHLHSIYNPVKEAESLMQKHEESLQKQTRVLVMGLGFGYHLSELERILARYHREWEIFVIEADPQMYYEFQKHRPCEISDRVQIICASDVNEIYDNIDLIRFMAEKPFVLPHSASFNLREDYFKSFMSFEASTRIDRVAQKVQNDALRAHILNLGQHDEDFEQALEARLNSGKLSANDFLLGALATLSAAGANS